MDLDTYFKMRSTTREQFVESDVKPVAQKRLERGLILDEIVRKEQLQIDDESLNVEYNNALNNLVMQGMDLSKIRGGKKGQKELSQAIAMDAASRVMTRKALDMLKSIATGNYKTFEEREAEAKKAAEAAAEEESAPAEAGEEKAAE